VVVGGHEVDVIDLPAQHFERPAPYRVIVAAIVELMAATGEKGGSGRRSTAAELVSAARSKRCMSQRELARAAGVPQSTVSTIESGQRQPSVPMVEWLLDAAGFGLETRLVNAIRPAQLLEQYRDEVAKVLAGYPVSRIWVFGSVARGDDRPDSDLDLLIELTPGTSVIDILGLDEELAAVLGCPVDVVTTTELESNDLLRRGVNRHRRPLIVAA
jgi:predicted nucleotidyltransferase